LEPETAAIAIGCIYERGGHINSAGGYLRDLTRNAERGEFSVGPMVMALLRTSGEGAFAVATWTAPWGTIGLSEDGSRLPEVLSVCNGA
jgi:hypothetical protein